MKKQKGNVLGSLLGLAAIGAVIVAAVWGYIWNIIKLFSITNAGDHVGELVIRVIGVFTGVVGAIAGYF